jgi:2-aminoadipate transaminase
MVEWGNKFSARVSSLKPSAIRELLSLVNDPEIISLAGGMPDPSLFPKEIIADISKEVFLNNASKALQYGATEGVPPLRESLLKMTREEAVKEAELENIIITTASQQGLSLLAEIFINPGDSVIVEAPSYVGGLQAFHAFQANFTTIPLDDEGIKVDILKEKLKELKANNVNTKFIYVIPNFQNPAGVTMSLERRKKLLEISHFYGIPIIEDDPYGDIRFKGEKIPSLLELDKIGIVIELRTFSKILAPGLRLGWIVADKEVTKKVSLAKQAADLCSPSSTQYIVDKFIRDGHLNNYLEIVRKNYKIKLDSMLGALEKYFPEETTWTEPQGGMFVWAEVPEYIDTDQLFREALQEKVAYVIGSAFYPYGEDKHHMRLNFSLNTPEKIEEGIKRLGNLLKKKIH